MQRRYGILVFLGLWLAWLWPAAVSGAAEAPVTRLTTSTLEQIRNIKEKEAALEAREEALDKRQEELESLRKELDDKITRLTALQAEAEGKLQELRTVKDTRFKNLVKVYSGMSASKVAPLLAEMDVKIASEILQAMKTETVAKILPKLEPEKAVAISREMGLLSVSSQPAPE